MAECLSLAMPPSAVSKSDRRTLPTGAKSGQTPPIIPHELFGAKI
jgi:hypothetical protein